MSVYKKSFGLLNKNKKRIFLIILIEFLFLFLLFLSGSYVYNELIKNYKLLENIGLVLGENIENNLMLLNEVLNKLFLTILYFLIFVILFSSLVLGLTSGYCCRFLREKKLNLKYFLKFFILVLIWFVIFLLISLMNSLFSGNLGAVLFLLVFVIVFYFTLVSFGVFLLRDRLKEGVKGIYLYGVKRFKRIFPYYLSGIVVLGGVGALFTYLSRFYETLAVIGIFLFLFLSIWFRVLFLKILE